MNELIDRVHARLFSCGWGLSRFVVGAIAAATLHSMSKDEIEALIGAECGWCPCGHGLDQHSDDGCWSENCYCRKFAGSSETSYKQQRALGWSARFETVAGMRDALSEARDMSAALLGEAWERGEVVRVTVEVVKE